jgi:hypothetical protein
MQPRHGSDGLEDIFPATAVDRIGREQQEGQPDHKLRRAHGPVKTKERRVPPKTDGTGSKRGEHTPRDQICFHGEFPVSFDLV